MRRFRVPGLAVISLLGAWTASALAQPAAPPVPGPHEIIMGVKTTEPMRVVEKRFEATPDVAEQEILSTMQALVQAVQEARLNFLPNWVRLNVLTPLEALQQGGFQPIEFALQIAVIEDVPAGPLEGDEDVQVVEVAPIRVAYTYGKGPYQAAPQQRAIALLMWIENAGHVAKGPIQLIGYHDPAEPIPDEVTFEIQVGVQEAP